MRTRGACIPSFVFYLVFELKWLNSNTLRFWLFRPCVIETA